MMQGKLIIISSPSGGGKDSVINALLKVLPNSGRLVTTTTRPLRPGNQEGRDYHFVSPEEFAVKIKNNELLEYNVYTGNYYGAEKKRLAEALEKYTWVFTQIEVNGKHNLDKQGIFNIAIFLLPESIEILEDRIRKRGGLTEEIIKERMEIARQEIAKSTDYDLRIVNQDGKLVETVAKIREFLLELDKKEEL